MSAPTVSTGRYFVVFAILLACTYVTWQIAYFDLGVLNTVAALGIAAFKAMLVALVFMQLRSGSRLNWLVVLGGLFWLAILLGLTASDYLTRNWTS